MMSNDTYYFSHDYNARNDIKVKRLLVKHGMNGYGAYWSIIEDLYNNANALPTDYDTIAYELRIDTDVVKSIINDFDLFVVEGDKFYSLSVQRRLEERQEKSDKARKSAFERWDKVKRDANAMQSHSEGNAIKERKGKEIKGKDSIEVSKSFYTEEMESNKEADQYELYVKFITYLFKNNPTNKPCKWLNLEHQVTYKQFTNLLKLAGSLENIFDKVDIGINKPSYLTGKKVMHTTLKNWMK